MASFMRFEFTELSSTPIRWQPLFHLEVSDAVAVAVVVAAVAAVVLAAVAVVVGHK